MGINNIYLHTYLVSYRCAHHVKSKSCSLIYATCIIRRRFSASVKSQIGLHFFFFFLFQVCLYLPCVQYYPSLMYIFCWQSFLSIRLLLFLTNGKLDSFLKTLNSKRRVQNRPSRKDSFQIYIRHMHALRHGVVRVHKKRVKSLSSHAYRWLCLIIFGH